jgi:hypothetical protein
MNCVPAEKSQEQLAREDIERQALESAAARLERESGNPVYVQAWKRAARILRGMKP